jgi:outer membrane protein TolC
LRAGVVLLLFGSEAGMQTYKNAKVALCSIACGMGLFWVQAVYAEVLNLDMIFEKALASSIELQIAQKTVEISQTEVPIAKADYFPTLQPRVNIEYLKDLENSVRPVVSVGNTVIPSGTRFQNSIGLNFNHTLVDFGERKHKMNYAKKGILASVADYHQAKRDLKLRMVDLYSDALIHFQTINANKAILELATEAYKMKKRLFQAGSISQVDVTTEAIQVAQAMDDIETFKAQLDKDLQDIGHYTSEQYDAETTELETLQETPLPVTSQFNWSETPESQQYEAKIGMKEQEIEILERKYLPKISLYSYYNMYGFHPDSWGKSLTNLSQRTISGGLSIALPSFEGFKNRALLQKAKLEKEKLFLEKTSVLAELKHKADLLSQEVESHTVLLKTKATILNHSQRKMTLETRLSESQLIAKTQPIHEHIERIRHQLEAEKTIIQKRAATLKLSIMETAV